MASRRTEIVREIAADPQTVWDVLVDVGAWADWNPTVISIEGAGVAGTSVKLVSTLSPKRTFTLKVDEVTAPRRMVWSDGMPFGLFTGTRTYTVDAAPAGAVFTMVEEYAGPMAGLIIRSIPELSGSFAEFADGLQQAAEGSA
jgi:uncharacterized protein YndB with AHSA1/START domain